MRRFYLHKRDEIYYAELVDPKTGKKLTAKSTGKESRDDAVIVVNDWLRDGVPDGRSRKPRKAAEAFTVSTLLDSLRRAELTNEDAGRILDILKAKGLILSGAIVKGSPAAESFAAFLRTFWSYTESPYIAEKKAHGQTIGKDHTRHSLERIEKYWIAYFGESKTLAEMTRADLRAFSLSLADPKKALKPATRNRILVAGKSALRWAYEREVLAEDVTKGIQTFSGEAEKRGVLTPDEAADLFGREWKDHTSKIINLVAATTGLRLGEILALSMEDIGETVLYVRHSWSDIDGLKKPKTNENRRVPLLPEIRKALLTQCEASPYGKDGFIFYGLSADRPLNPNVPRDALRDELTAMDIDAKGRGITPHSWRHFYSARMMDRLTPEKIMRATGHRTRAVFDGYADHVEQTELDEIGAVAGEVFGRIVAFRK